MTDAELVDDLRWLGDSPKRGGPEHPHSSYYHQVADRLAALAADRDAAVARAAELEEACRRAMRYCAGVNLAGPQAARCELSDALLAGTGGGR